MVAAANEQDVAIFAALNLVEPKAFALIVIINPLFFSFDGIGVTKTVLDAFFLRESLKRCRAGVRFPSCFFAKFFGQKCEVVCRDEFSNVSIERRSFVQNELHSGVRIVLNDVITHPDQKYN